MPERELDRDNFMRLLGECMDDEFGKASSLLTVSGITEIMSEELDGEVKSRWHDEETERIQDETEKEAR